MSEEEITDISHIQKILKHGGFFLAVREGGSITGGAEIMKTDPKTVTNNLKILKELFGGEPLLEDLGSYKRKNKITPHGRRIYIFLKKHYYLTPKKELNDLGCNFELFKMSATDIAKELQRNNGKTD